MKGSWEIFRTSDPSTDTNRERQIPARCIYLHIIQCMGMHYMHVHHSPAPAVYIDMVRWNTTEDYWKTKDYWTPDIRENDLRAPKRKRGLVLYWIDVWNAKHFYRAIIFFILLWLFKEASPNSKPVMLCVLREGAYWTSEYYTRSPQIFWSNIAP